MQTNKNTKGKGKEEEIPAYIQEQVNAYMEKYFAGKKSHKDITVSDILEGIEQNKKPKNLTS